MKSVFYSKNKFVTILMIYKTLENSKEMQGLKIMFRGNK